MKNELRIIESETANYIAVFTGKTGSGECVKDEEAHKIYATNRDEATRKSLIVWGADLENTNVTFEN